MEYNNTQEIVHDEDFEIAANILFRASGLLALIEIIAFYCSKVQGTNLEINAKTMKPRIKNKFVRGFGFLTVILTATAVIIGLNAFNELGCKENWFVEDENICKSCTTHFGDECLLCTDSNSC